MTAFSEWSLRDAAALIARPSASDDKYSRGVLGVVTGSELFPGAAVIGVESALRTGVGMLRYLGPERAASLVLARRPETVVARGRVQAWLLGSGIDAESRDFHSETLLRSALAEGLPSVIDAGALELVGEASGPVVITPHARELGRVLGVEAEQISAEPQRWAREAAGRLGVSVLLKGSVTHVAAPDGSGFTLPTASPWLATAGTGDALAGILGALVATHADEIAADERMLARLAATACVIHAEAARRAGGPFTVMDLAGEITAVVAGLLA